MSYNALLVLMLLPGAFLAVYGLCVRSRASFVIGLTLLTVAVLLGVGICLSPRVGVRV